MGDTKAPQGDVGRGVGGGAGGAGTGGRPDHRDSGEGAAAAVGLRDSGRSVPCAVPLVPCAVPLVPSAIPLVPCVVSLVPCVAPVVPSAVPLLPCAIPPLPCVVPLPPCVVPLLPCVVPVVLCGCPGDWIRGGYWRFVSVVVSVSGSAVSLAAVPVPLSGVMLPPSPNRQR